jgi:uncharacterized membrane protein
MSTRASVKGHPIHAMLVPLPIGLWVFAAVADFMGYETGAAAWQLVAYYAIGGGLVGAALAAVAGLVDLTGLDRGPVRRTATVHMVVNVLAVAVSAASFVIRWGSPDHAGPRLLSLVVVALLAFSGWLGGELVYVHRVGVDPAVSRKMR